MAVAESDQLRLYSDILEMSFGVSEPFELASPDDSISLEAGALRLETSLHAATSPPGAVPRLVARQPAEQPAGGPKADSGYGRVARVTVDAGSPGRAQPAQESRQRGAPRTPGMAVVCGKPRQQPESDDTQSVVDPRSHAPKAASKTEHRVAADYSANPSSADAGRQQAPAQDSARRRGALQRVAAQQRQMSSEQQEHLLSLRQRYQRRQGGAPSHPPGDFDRPQPPRPASVSETPPPPPLQRQTSTAPLPSRPTPPMQRLMVVAASDVRAMKTQVLADVAAGNEILAGWDRQHNRMLSALGQAAPEMPSHVVDVIMDCLQERDQEVRQLCSRTGENRHRVIALEAEMSNLRSVASAATSQVEGYGGKVQQLENELEATRQEKAAMEARCEALQHHFQATSGHIADVVKRAGGAAESTEALEAEVAALRQRLQTAEAAREESEALAAQEQESARQLVEAMDQGLQRQREQYLRLESDMASQDDEAAELRYRNALLGDHVNHLHHALGALHQRRRRHAVLSSVLTEWCGLAAERCALHHLQEATRRRLALSWRQRLFAAWRAEARLAADRASTITSALTLAACEAFRTQAQLPAAASLCRTQCWPIPPGSALSLLRVARVAAAFLRWHRFLELRRHKRWACRVVQSRADARQREAVAAAFLAWRGWGAACRRNARAMRLMQRMRARHVLLGAFRHWKSLALVEQSTKEGQTAACVAEYLAASWPPRRLLRAWARAASAASRERGCLAASLSARASLRLAYSAWAAWSSQVARGRLLDQFTRRHCLRSLALVWRAWKDAVHATLSKEFDSISIYIYRLLSSCLHAWRHVSVGARRLKHIERVVLGRDVGKAALLLQVAVRRERQALARALRGWAHWLAVRRIQAGMFGRMAERCELSTVLGALRAWQGYARMRADAGGGDASDDRRPGAAPPGGRLPRLGRPRRRAGTRRPRTWRRPRCARRSRMGGAGGQRAPGAGGDAASCLAGWRQAASSAVIAKLQGYNHRLRCFEAALRQMSSKGETSALRGALLGWRGLVARAGETRRRLAAFCWRGALRRLRRLFGPGGSCARRPPSRGCWRRRTTPTCSSACCKGPSPPGGARRRAAGKSGSSCTARSDAACAARASPCFSPGARASPPPRRCTAAARGCCRA
eukprot:jgi/Tetstr1/429178/TSEL_019131.t1